MEKEIQALYAKWLIQNYDMTAEKYDYILREKREQLKTEFTTLVDNILERRF